MKAAQLIRESAAEPAWPWPRHVLTPDAWRDMAYALEGDPDLQLVALWADTVQVHALFLDPAGVPLPASVPVEAGLYAALSPARPGAALFERAIADLWGHEAAEALDTRPWLDHGSWPYQRPLSLRPVPAGAAPEPPEFLPCQGEDLHVLALGPVAGEIAESAHLRLTGAGETLVRVESRLGYAHRGILAHLRGKPPRAAARLVARLTGDAAVAHGTAYAAAVEAALRIVIPPRATAIRAVLLEWERITAHLTAIAAICEAAGNRAVPTTLAALRETLLRTAAEQFGHRLLRDLVVPGGLAADLRPESVASLRAALDAVDAELPALWHLLDTPGVADRIAGTGVIPPELAGRFAACGPVGRASGQGFDARHMPGAPLSGAGLSVPVLSEGDLDARLRVLLTEITGSIALLRAALAALPEGEIGTVLPSTGGEGFGVAEGARGATWHWVRIEGGTVAAAFPADPSWRHLPLLDAAALGGGPADLPMVRHSLLISVAGMDL